MAQNGAITIDESNRRFKISGKKVAKSSGLIGKAVKGTLAISTFGMSALAEKAITGGNKTTAWIPFDSLIDYSIRRDQARESSSVGVGTSLGGIGVGSSKSVSKNVTQSMEIIVNIDDLKTPYVIVPITDKPLRGKEAEKAQKYCDDTVAALNYILRHR